MADKKSGRKVYLSVEEAMYIHDLLLSDDEPPEDMEAISEKLITKMRRFFVGDEVSK